MARHQGLWAGPIMRIASLFARDFRISVEINIDQRAGDPLSGLVCGVSRPTTACAPQAVASRSDSSLWAQEWAEALVDSSGFSQEHADKSLLAVQAFLSHSGGELSRRAARKWLKTLQAAGSRKTAQNKLSALRQWGEFLEAEHCIDENPWRGIAVARGYRAPGWAPFEAAEVSRLIAAAEARESRKKRGSTNTGPLCSTWYAVLALTGLRYSECCALKWEHLDWKLNTVVVRKDKAKRADVLPMSTECVAALKLWKSYVESREWSRGASPRRRGEGFVFPMCPSHHSLEVDMATAGIEKGAERRGQWHRFRKCAIAERAAAGASVRDLHHFARHSDPRTTLQIYDRATASQLRDCAELMPRLNGFLEKGIDKPRGLSDDDPVKTENRTMEHTQNISRLPVNSPMAVGLDNLGLTAARVGAKRSDVERDAPASQDVQNGAGGNRPHGFMADEIIRAHRTFLDLMARLLPGAADVQQQQ